ncbi:MAG TPA: ATP-binding cassette domain-containing protein [Jatrophihabitans sp.]|jgi:ABC-2 type transport system ATP-binding protein|uniref:ATP-binding cassette domain-containing protein n=1 Tax=Jatrophihabitans sp. TaxID=1932789 RepID=UPI002EF0F7AE
MIEATGLRKSYKRGHGRKATPVEAVRGVDFSVQRGEIFGFLGPNGAGKSTTLRMLSTLTRPDGGEAMIAGADVLRAPAQVRDNIGYVAQVSGTYDMSNARRELVLQARMHGLPKSTALTLCEAAVKAFQLEDFADREIKTYSGGQRRRLDVALGVIHSPKVMFLDEPTAGLDPPSRARMWQEVRRLRDEGMTIFLTTHYLDEADALCDRISIIDGGLIVAEGTPAALKREISGDVVVLDMAASDTAGVVDPNVVHEAEKLLLEEPYVTSSEVVEGTVRLYVESSATAIPNIMRTLLDKGIEPGAVEARRPSLDDVFLAKTGRLLTD